MRQLILLVLGAILLVGSFLLYPEAIKVMSGDYMLSRWVTVTETNKNWAMVLFLGVVGGCLTWIGYKLYNRRKLKL